MELLEDLTGEVREQIHDYIASQEAKILTMQVKEPSLEEIFLKLTE
ncbi:ATP-binding protein DrrA1-3 family domain-containing protein [Thermococcus sp.]